MLRVFLIFLALSYFFIPQHAFAHLPGQPPFFKINNTYSNLYPIQQSSYTHAFTLPQDLAAETYLINQPLLFTIEPTSLPFPEDMVSNTDFFWDFGDKTTATGLSNTHTYKKIGSYILVIMIAPKGSPKEKELLQSVMLHVLPDKKYVLPKPLISVNGKTKKDFDLGVIEANLRNNITFDVSLNKPTAPISSYLWDFDDGQKANGKTQIHNLSSQREFIAPILRLTDKNGFVTDTSETILHKKPGSSFFKNPLPLPLLLLLFPCIVIIVIFLLLWKKK